MQQTTTTKKNKQQTTTMPDSAIKPCPVAVQELADGKNIGEAVARHGDLMLIKATLPKDAKPLQGNEILRSATTGHIHGVKGAVKLFTAASGVKEFGTSTFLVVEGPALMALHLEHKDAPLPTGTYEARRKREGRADFQRLVVD